MLYAIGGGRKIRATPGARAACSYCGAEMLAKCGEVNIWHWAHIPSATCDVWAGGETYWHLWWKSRVPESWCEVLVHKQGITHIADIKRPDGLVVEVQHSSLSPSEIRAREAFYGNMLWLFDTRDCLGLDLRKRGGYHTFRWKHARTSLAYTSKRTYLDVGRNVFELKRMHRGPPCGGWGRLWDVGDFVKMLCNCAVHRVTAPAALCLR